MNKKDLLYKEKQLEAMFHLLNETDIYFFRKVCRWYSEKFHTPLHVVMDGNTLPWDDILLHYYETQFEDIGYNNAYELACRDYVPELADYFEQENEDFAKALEAEQLETIKRKEKKVGSKLLKNKEKTEDMSSEILKPPAPIKMSFEDEEEINE